MRGCGERWWADPPAPPSSGAPRWRGVAWRGGPGPRRTCPAPREWAEAMQGGGCCGTRRPASCTPACSAARQRLLQPPPAPKEAFRDPGNSPIRLTWSRGRANPFISSASSPGGKFNNRRRQSNISYNSCLPFLSPSRFSPLSPPPPRNKRFSTVVFTLSSLPQADILPFISCFSIKLADCILETHILPLPPPPPRNTIFIPETNLSCVMLKLIMPSMCCPKSDSYEGEFCTETA